MNKPTNKELLYRILERLEALQYELTFMAQLIGFTLNQERKMTDKLDDVISDIGDLTTVEEGTAAVIDHAVDLLDSIGQKLQDAQNDPKKLAAIRAEIKKNAEALGSKKEALSEAVMRNTPLQPSQE